MSMFNQSEPFDAFHEDTAIYSGRRREGGASRSAGMALACCVLGGAYVGDMNGERVGTSTERVYTVLIRRDVWPEHLPPQQGDAMTIEDYPDLTVQRVTADADGWALECVGKGAA